MDTVLYCNKGVMEGLLLQQKLLQPVKRHVHVDVYLVKTPT